MLGKLVLPLLAGGLAVSALLGSVCGDAAQAPEVLLAGGDCASSVELDSDGDFLPDALEWAVLTNSASPDTDGDSVPDFVEVVQKGRPRHPGAPEAMDHELRLVLTSCGSAGAGGASGWGQAPLTWMHVLLRIADSASTVQQFALWLELPHWPGLRIPLLDFASGAVVVRERSTQEDGRWLQVSLPLVAPHVLASVLPCTLIAEARIGGRNVASAVSLFQWQGETISLVPFGDGRFVMQTLAPTATSSGGGSGTGCPEPGTLAAQFPDGSATPPTGLAHTNRVCLLDLQEIGSGPAGTMYEVVDANCESALELECGADCTDSVGYILTIPGGLALVGGN